MIGVECRFLSDGRVELHKIEVNGRWLPVDQGRQWVDREGRHVLIMVPGQAVQELNLRPDTMTWQMRPVGPPAQQLV